MVPDYGYGLQASNMLNLFFMFSLLSYPYLNIMINIIKKL